MTGSQSRFGDGWRDERRGEIAKERGGESAILEAEDTDVKQKQKQKQRQRGGIVVEE